MNNMEKYISLVKETEETKALLGQKLFPLKNEDFKYNIHFYTEGEEFIESFEGSFNAAVSSCISKNIDTEHDTTGYNWWCIKKDVTPIAIISEFDIIFDEKEMFKFWEDRYDEEIGHSGPAINQPAYFSQGEE